MAAPTQTPNIDSDPLTPPPPPWNPAYDYMTTMERLYLSEISMLRERIVRLMDKLAQCDAQIASMRRLLCDDSRLP